MYRHTFLLAILLLQSTIVLEPLPAQPPGPASASLLEKAKSVLAQLDGTISIDGLHQPVRILRDKWGVPHIYAEDQHDLFFSQGFVAAQDRLYQIDMWRRLSVGETAEILGEESLVRDQFARLTRFRGSMENEWASYAPDTKEIATAFTSGINAYIKHIGDRLPIEFQMLGYHPKPWKPEDVLGRLSVLAVARNLDAEVNRAALVAAVGVEQANKILPTDPSIRFEPSPELDLTGINASILRGYTKANSELSFLPKAESSPKAESNNWAIDGTLSGSGKPMMASDPHRALTLPSLRYIVHLNAPGWNVIGGGEPALPGVALGHNEHIAWGFTIAGTDQADLIVERLNPNDPTQYERSNEWQPITVIRESVNVRKTTSSAPTSAVPTSALPDGLESVEIELQYTHHGPIIHIDHQRHRAYVLRWMGSEPGTAAYLASLSVDRAHNWKEFLAACSRWHAPSQNMVYADVDGNIGWMAAALTPIRRNWNGLLPVPGHRDEFNWRGFLASSDLPQISNPLQHYVITANHNILPPNYKHEIGYEFAPSSRYDRLKELMESKRSFTLEDFKSMQYDATSMVAREIVNVLTSVAIDIPNHEEQVRKLAQWNGKSDIGSAEAALYAVWYKELSEEFFASKVPKELIDFAVGAGTMRMVRELRQPTEDWFGSSPQADRDRLISKTLTSAIRKCVELMGNDTAKWSLGKIRRMHFKHPTTKLGQANSDAFDLAPMPSASNAHAPNQARYDASGNRLHGASYRHILDLADWDLGQATNAPGQSGQPGSPYYSNLADAWDRGDYFPLAFSKAKVESVTEHRLNLVPIAR